MKKTIALLLTAMILAGAFFTGCGKTADEASSSAPDISSIESVEQDTSSESEASTDPEEPSKDSQPEEGSSDFSEPSEGGSSETSSASPSSESPAESKPEAKPSAPSSQPPSQPAQESSVSSSAPSSSNTENPSESSDESSESTGVSASVVYSAINGAFQSQYGHDAIPSMTMTVDDTILTEKFHLTSDMVESYAGAIAGIMTNCDELLVVQAKDGQIDHVKAALEQALADQNAAFGWYAVMNNAERLEAAKVVVKGNYAALLIVGISPENAEDEGAVDFSGDVSLAENAFYGAIG